MAPPPLQAELRLLLDARLAAAVIGRGGGTVRRIRLASSVDHIQLSQHAPPAKDRELRLSGCPAAVLHAYALVAEVLRAEAPARPGAAERLRLLVPDAESLAGAAAIEKLRRGSGATIQRDGEARGGKEALLACEGRAEQLEALVRRVVDAVARRHHARHRDFLSQWAFATSYNDHFETPAEAYADVLPVLRAVALQRWRREHGRKRKRAEEEGVAESALSQLVVYDPYYCQGSMRHALATLGVAAERCINENRDFYKDVDECTAPPHDVLVTNPPYSAEHKQRLLQILLRTHRGEPRAGLPPAPFLLLMPAWLAGTDYWQDFVAELAAHVASQEGPDLASSPRKPEARARITYVCPQTKYSFAHPEATGKPTSPFHAIWFCGGWESARAQREAMAALKPARVSGKVKLFRTSAMLRKHGYYTKF
ncbi:hypothetical protein AB1Y20_002917 [Prymnesium parvum]|uniref:K Homology domain-containing protein n=1 Tax=Prymnesium parvum TaxID=97485 RepID=A0AB34JAA4_PRYPA